MIERMLKEKIGLNYDSIGRKNVESAVSMHMKKHGMSSEKDYLELISASDKHFEELTQSLLVPETWFFRYSESFAFLTQYAEKYIAGQRHPLHILSIPCSSGEEPYSIAMTLLNAGVPPGLIHIDAADVSAPVLEKARRSVYGSNSFRGGIPETMQHFFLIKDGKHEVIQQVKDLVKFQRFSIFDHKFQAERPHYNLIFCRNLLIYFSSEEQAKTMAILSGMLTADGILFLGHVESGMISRHDFESVKYPSCFAFRKKSIHAITPAKPPLEPAAKPLRAPPAKALHKTRRFNIEPATIKVSKDSDTILQKAAALADSGNLEEAETLCVQYLDHNKLNPFAYYTLGVVSLSSDRLPEAEKAFSKAVYLNPEYYEALVHLALLKERQGEKAEALKIRKRAEKLTTVNKQ
ncbi:MAG: CheR family methyltransferase [Lentisphaerota bacterium]